MLDLYCERLGPGLFGEPLNAISNLGFLLGAWWAWRRVAPAHPAAAPAVRTLALLLALVGLASTSFHTLATPLTGFLDVAFIGLFNVAYLILVAYHVLGLSRWWAILCGAAFIGFDQLRMAVVPAGFLHGSGMYLPPLLVLLWLAMATLPRSRAAGLGMLQAAALFCVSLLGRTLDQPLCTLWPFGLHFVWHLLNALVLIQLIRAFAVAASSLSAGDPPLPR